MVLNIRYKKSPDYEMYPNFADLFGSINLAKKMWTGLLYKTIYIL